MMELQDFCESNNEFMADEAIEMGQAYACKQDDGVWYR